MTQRLSRVRRTRAHLPRSAASSRSPIPRSRRRDPTRRSSGPTDRSGTTPPGSRGSTRTTSGTGATPLSVGAAAAKAGFDEIQFDYVRFPSDGEIGSIVYPRSVQRAEGPNDRALPSLRERAPPPARRARVRRPVRARCDTRSRRRPVTRSSSAAISTRSTRWSTRRTSCRASTTSSSPRRSPVGRSRTRSRTTARTFAKDGVRIVPWLQDFSLRRPYGLAEVEDQVQAARQTHADGFLLWNPLGVYTQEALASR